MPPPSSSPDKEEMSPGLRLKIDDGKFFFDGKPKFLMGVYDSGLGYFNKSSQYEAAIFDAGSRRELNGIPLNAYLNYHYGEAPVRAMNALMDALRGHGMMYFQTVNCFEDGSYRRINFNLLEDENVRDFAQHPAAAGYYIMDECSDSLVEETREHHRHLHRLDPRGLTFATLYPALNRDWSLWTNAADILSVDSYPLYDAEPPSGYPHFRVADAVARLRKTVPSERPIVATLQLFKFTTKGRLPTYAEMRSHAIMSIIEGAQGIFWWEIGANGLRKSGEADIGRTMDNLKRLVTELDVLQPVLVSSANPSLLKKNSTGASDPVSFRIDALRHNISVDPLYANKRVYKGEIDALQKGDASGSYLLDQGAFIRTLAKRIGNRGYLFAYNYTNQSRSATFTWHKRPRGSVAVNAEGRSIDPQGDSFTDSFGPYEAHVYVIPE